MFFVMLASATVVFLTGCLVLQENLILLWNGDVFVKAHINLLSFKYED